MHPGIEFSPCSTELGHEEVSVPFVYQMCELKRLIIRQLKKAAVKCKFKLIQAKSGLIKSWLPGS